jgi:putative transposase
MRYTTDLTDAEWQLIHYCFPKPSKTGRPREHSFRELLDAMFYLVRTACQWRNLPKDFAPWRTVYHYLRLWKRTGLWERIHTHLREHLRQVEGRQRQATAGIIDSQSVKSTECSDQRGYDAGKKVNGRKRHVLVDTLGLVLAVLVLPANIQDRDAARQLLAMFFRPKSGRCLKHIWADGGYAGVLIAWARDLWHCTVEIVKRTDVHTFRVLPRRWVVERTFGWLGRYRRLNRDYERLARTGESMIYAAMIRLMLARLARS